VKPLPRQTIEPLKHQAVNIAERQSLRRFAPQHVELVSKDKDLGFQLSPRPEHSDQGAPDQPAKIAPARFPIFRNAPPRSLLHCNVGLATYKVPHNLSEFHF